MADTVTGKATTGTYVRQGQPTTRFHSGSKTLQYVSNDSGSVFQSYVYTNKPTDLANRTVTSAVLEVEMRPGTGSRTLTVQRHAKLSVPSYSTLTYATRPSVLSGSTAVSRTQDSADTTWVFDVTADLQAMALGGAFYGWRITTTYTGVWGMHGWGSANAATLYVELDGQPDAPEELRPDGITALAAPTFTWLPVNDLISARLQVAAVGATWDATDGFTSPTWDSGDVTTTIPQLDSDALGWTGLAEDDVVEVTAMQTTTGGPSPWRDPVTVTRKSLPIPTITSPTGTTEDPTPTITWTASEQDGFRVLLSSGATLLDDSLDQPGDDSAWQTKKGATQAGQALTARVRVYPLDKHSPSPGDPGYAEDSVTFTYSPGIAPSTTAVVAVQFGATPWVDIVWSREDVPDEYIVLRDGVQVARFDGIDGDGDPVTSYRDWTCPPNTDVTYNVQPVVEGAAGLIGPTTALRTVVDGEWVGDPDSGRYFQTSGELSDLAHTEDSVTYAIPGAVASVTRTFGLHGYTGPGGGALPDEVEGRDQAAQLEDVWAIKGAPHVTYRYAAADQNFPCWITNLTPTTDKDWSFAVAAPAPREQRKRVAFTVTQNGETPFPTVPL